MADGSSKLGLLGDPDTPARNAGNKSGLGLCSHYWRLLQLAVSMTVLTFILWEQVTPRVVSKTQAAAPVCPQTAPLIPSDKAWVMTAVDDYLSKANGKAWAIENLGGAVRIPTQTFDDIKPPGEDSRWNVFLELHTYLENRFPLVHSKLSLHKINQYGLVFTWAGSDQSLAPIVLAAHLDVVPVNLDTADEWKHPPFSGLFDGTWIWGRGSCDDKSMLIATLSAVELLLKQGFAPTRSVILAYGFDEERGGRYGAQNIAQYLSDNYGYNGIAFIIDEGGQYQDRGDVIIAAPSIAEKGSVNIVVEVTTPGGHASVPPPHTGIGYLARLITTLEDHPFPVQLSRTSTYFRLLQCAAEHDASIPSELRDLISRAGTDDSALMQLELEMLASDEDNFRAYAGTTQAIDIIHGGVKVNALPESVYAIVDHRIAEHSSTADVRSRYVDLLAPYTSTLNLSFEAFGTLLSGSDGFPTAGLVRLTDPNGGLEPAPVTPTEHSAAWEILSGTILASLETSKLSKPSKRVVVAPNIMVANSDTRWYWRLTRNIFRYNHVATSDLYNGMHTINEAIRADGYIESIRFFVRLILNVDESELFN